MGSRLHRVSDWPSRAREAEYCSETMAILCGVGERQLERFFHKEFQTTPGTWIEALRMNIARLRIEEGQSTKAVAEDFFFSGPSQFCRAFKKYFGVPPQFFAPMSAGVLMTRRQMKPSASAHNVGFSKSIHIESPDACYTLPPATPEPGINPPAKSCAG